MLSRVKIGVASLLEMSPLFLGPLIVQIPASRFYIEPYLVHFSYLILLVVAWSVLIRFIIYWYIPTIPNTPDKAIEKSEVKIHSERFPFLKIPLLVALSILALLALHLFKNRCSYLQFFLGTATVILGSISRIWIAREQYFRGLIGRWLFLSALGYLSYLFTSFAFHWQAIVVAISLASVISGHKLFEVLGIAELQGDSENASQPRAESLTTNKFSMLVKVGLFLLLFGPLAMSYLTFNGFLNHDYLSLFLTYPLIARISPDSGRIGHSITAQKELPKRSLIVALGYVVIMVVLAVV